MSIALGILCVLALLLAWAEKRSSGRLFNLSLEYRREGEKSWDRGQELFRDAIERHRKAEALLDNVRTILGTSAPEEGASDE